VGSVQFGGQTSDPKIGILKKIFTPYVITTYVFSEVRKWVKSGLKLSVICYKYRVTR
jgi:hypothetical protein